MVISLGIHYGALKYIYGIFGITSKNKESPFQLTLK